MSTAADATATTLNVLLGTYGHTRALKEGRIAPPGARLAFTEIQPVHRGFHLMVDRQEFDVAEVALTTYILARSFGRPITALPIVVTRGFHHARLMYNVASGIREPKDLEGRRVGLRSYTQTIPLWVRAFLASDYGVDLDTVTWVAFEPAHVRAYRPPANVVMAPEGRTLNEMLLAGELDAAIGAEGIEAETIRPLLPHPAAAQRDWYRRTGIYPINHLITVASALAAERPELLRALYDAFLAARDEYLAHLAGAGPFSAEDESWLAARDLVGGDPLPYGIGPNRRALEAAAELAFQQHITPRLLRLDELFEPDVVTFDV